MANESPPTESDAAEPDAPDPDPASRDPRGPSPGGRAEDLWRESFSEGIDEEAEHYVLAKHLDARTHKAIEDFAYEPAIALAPAGGSVLDIGCGSGFFCDEFEKRGHTVCGIDFNGDLIEIAKKRYPRLEFHELDIYRCGELARRFDLVICAGVIQSIFEPARAYEQIASLQESGGHLSVCARNRSFLGNFLTPLVTKVFLRFQLPFRYYTLGELVQLGEAAGYEAIDRRFVYVFPGPFGAFNDFFNRSRILNRLAFPLAVHVLAAYRKR